MYVQDFSNVDPKPVRLMNFPTEEIMKRMRNLTAGLMISAGLLAACSGGPDHEAIQQAVYDGTDSAVDAIIDSLVLMEKSAHYEDLNSRCSYSVALPGEEPTDEVYCENVMLSAEDLEAEYAELRQELDTRIFHEDNVEDTDSDSMTLLLRGDIFCQPDDFYDSASYDLCVEDVDALQIRLNARMVDDDTAGVELWLGPDKIHPLTFTFGPQQLSVALVLDELEPAIGYVADTFGEEFEEFAETLEGEVELGFFADGDLRKFALLIHDDVTIEIDDGEYFLLTAQAVGEVASFGVDIAQELLVGSLSLGEFALIFDDWSSTAPGGYNEFAVHLAGLSADAVLDPNDERIELFDVGLGGGPATVDIDGEEVLHIDLNSGLGGLLNAVFHEQGDALKISVDPGLELDIGAFYHRVTDTFDDFDDWMLDEVLSFALTGDANPAVLIDDYGIEVIRGHLELSSASTSYGASVDAGMCLVEDYPDGVYDQQHPFEYLHADQCSD